MKKLLLIAVVFFACSCSSSKKVTMVKPNGCKPKKEVKHKMIEPDYPKNPKKLKQGK